MFKIGKYFTTYSITMGFLISIVGSLFIYLAYFNFSNPLIETILALLFFWYLLKSDSKIWFWSGFFISIWWFWWIVISFRYYHMNWAIPIGLISVAFIYGAIFYLISAISGYIAKSVLAKSSNSNTQNSILLKALGLLILSYIHPFSFDWFKPELMFVHSYLGISKWQFGITLLAITLSQYKKNILWITLVLLAYSPIKTTIKYDMANSPIALASTKTTVERKWDPRYTPDQIIEVFRIIDKAIKKHKKIVVLPESVFPFFLNKQPKILNTLLSKSNKITIIIGALYLDGKIHRNSTYIIQNGKYKIANKVVMVPFGESNPLPKWASSIVNKIFFDGAIDYIASSQPTDYKIHNKTYRNAICYEACNDKLYIGKPKNMIVLSNNGWFVPSIEPTLQRLLLEYYSQKYGTTIYHSANMSKSYMIKRVGINF